MSPGQSTSLQSLLTSRQYHASHQQLIKHAVKDSRSLLQRLELVKKIDAHNGCVNSLAWNSSGSVLLSGSDDHNLVVSDPFSMRILSVIKTPHTANIFSAKFLPNTSDSKMASCAGDGLIAFTDIFKQPETANCTFTCHTGTTYEIQSVPGDPHTFLSCGEDGTVRWFDTRIQTSCNKDNCQEDILIMCERGVSSMAINPVLPFELALGSSDSSVRLFDRRMLTTRLTGSTDKSPGLTALLSKFVVPEFEGCYRRITSVNYRCDGEEICASYSSDYVYTFKPKADDSSGKRRKLMVGRPSEGRLKKTGRARARASPQPMKKLRLRGDWSDTGPNSRPETERSDAPPDEGAEPTAERETSRLSLQAQLLHRMTEALSRMLTNPVTRMSVDREDSRDEENASQATEEENTAAAGEHGTTEDDSAIPGPSGRRSDAEAAMADEIRDNLNLGDDSSQIRGSAALTIQDRWRRFRERKLAKQKEEAGEAEAGPSTVPDLENNEHDNQEVQSEDPPETEEQEVGHPNEAASNQNIDQLKSGRDACSDVATNFSKGLDKCDKSGCESDGTKEMAQQGQNSEGQSLSSQLDDGAEGHNVQDDEQPAAKGVTGEENPESNKEESSNFVSIDTRNIPNEQTLSQLSQSASCPRVDDTPPKEHGMATSPDAERETDHQTANPPHGSEESSSSSSSADEEEHDSSQTDKQSCTSIQKSYNYDEFIGQRDDVQREQAANEEQLDDLGHEPLDGEDQSIYLHRMSIKEEEPVDEENKTEGGEQSADSTNMAADEEQSADEARGLERLRDSVTNLCQTVGVEPTVNLRYRSEGTGASSVDLSQMESLPGPSRVVTGPGHVAFDPVTGRRRRRLGVSSVPTSAILPEVGEGSSGNSLGEKLADSRGRDESKPSLIEYQLDSDQEDEEDEDEEDTGYERGRAILQPPVIQKLIGHRNARTMIKEATYWGKNYIMSGSDCGHLFGWDVRTGEIVLMLEADRHVVNCVCPHPWAPLLATAGIDYDIKFWSPTAVESQFDPHSADIVARRNELMLEETRDTITVPASLMIRMLASLNHIRREEARASSINRPRSERD